PGHRLTIVNSARPRLSGTLRLPGLAAAVLIAADDACDPVRARRISAEERVADGPAVGRQRLSAGGCRRSGRWAGRRVHALENIGGGLSPDSGDDRPCRTDR